MLRWWHGASLRTQLLLQLSVALVAILVAFVWVSLDAVNASTQEALDERRVVAQLMADRVDDQLSHALEMLKAPLSEANVDLEFGCQEPHARLLQGLFAHAAFFKRVMFVDPQGVILCTAPEPDSMAGVDITAPPYNLPITEVGGQAFLVNIGATTQKPGVAVVIPLAGRTQVFAGYLSGWIDLSSPQASPLLYPYQPSGGSYTDLVDSRGMVLMSSLPERVGKISDHAGYFGTLVRDRRTSVDTCHSCHDPQGTGRQQDVLAFASLNRVPWGLALHQPEAEVFAATRSLTYRLWALGAVVLAAFLALVWVASRQIVRPLEGLSKACGQIAAGDLSHPVPVSGVAEATALGASFENMRRDLLRYRQQTETQQRELEGRVEERTTELSQARDYLLKTNRNLMAINAVGAILGQSLDVTETLSAALARTLEAVGAEAGGICRRGPDGEPALVVQQGLSAQAVASLEKAPCRLMPVARRAADAASPWAETCQRHLAGQLAYASVACMGLEAKGEALGVLFVADSRPGHLSVQDRTLLASIARQIALALRNAYLYDALRGEERSRSELLHQLIAAQEEERKRIARELHDETSQALTALMVGLDTAGLALAVSPRETEERLGANKAIAQGMLDDIHRLIADLRPSLLDDLGLMPAITWYGENRLKPLGISLRVEYDGLERRLPPDMETVLFRIVQEALTNVIRHAAAKGVTVTLGLRDDCLVLQVSDDGRGFDPQRVHASDSQGSGLGLRGMQERVSILEGEFYIQSAPGEGTIITVRVPVLKEAVAYV